MNTYTPHYAALELRRPSSASKRAGDEVKAGSDAKKVVVRATEKLTDSASWLTLDDFGGRSDALGG
jgi:hypothetical protein